MSVNVSISHLSEKDKMNTHLLTHFSMVYLKIQIQEIQKFKSCYDDLKPFSLMQIY